MKSYSNNPLSTWIHQKKSDITELFKQCNTHDDNQFLNNCSINALKVVENL